jgi:hypothetical protein
LKQELEHFSERQVDHIKQDFYGMLTVSNMLSSILREVKKEVKKEQMKKEIRYEYRVKVNQATGVLKDQFIGIVITDDGRSRKWLYRELMRRRIVPIRLNREVARKGYLKNLISTTITNQPVDGVS